MPNTQTSNTQTSDAEPFSLTEYLVSNRSTGPIAHVAGCLQRQANLLPMALTPKMAELAIDVVKTAPKKVLLQAIAAIWMPTRRLFVEYPDATGTVGVFVEMTENTTFVVSRIRWDGCRVCYVPYATHVTPAEPRPEVGWGAIQNKRWPTGERNVWVDWLAANVTVITLQGDDERQQWAKDILFQDLFVVAMALATFGRRRFRITRDDNVEVMMAPGHE
nr:hypothetical protein [uncultured Rhodopila sp.]